MLRKIKYTDFYICEASYIFSWLASGLFYMLFTWLMIHQYNQLDMLGWFISAMFTGRVLALIIMSLYGTFINIKLLVVISTLLQAIALLAVTLYGNYTPWLLGTTLVLLNIADTFKTPVASSLTAALYDKKRIDTAIRISQVISTLSGIASLAVAGVAIKLVEPRLLVISMLLLFIMSLSGYIKIKPKFDNNTQKNYKWSAGIKAIRHNKLSLIMLSFAILQSLIFSPAAIYLVPILVIQKYGYSSIMVAFIEGLMGVAGILSSMYLNKLLNKLMGTRAVCVACLVLIAISGLILSFSDNIVTLALSMFLLALGAAISSINLATISILATPDRLRPATTAVSSLIALLPIPFGVKLINYLYANNYLSIAFIILSILSISIAFILWQFRDFKYLCSLTNEELENKYVELYPKGYAN